MSDHPHPVDVHVGRRLRLRRTILGLSQEAIGKVIGVTFQQIQKYERGINRMGASRLYDFSRALTVPIAYFYEGYGDYTQSDAGAQLGMAESEMVKFEHNELDSREVRDMMRAYHRIKNPAVRKRVTDLVKAFADSEEAAPVKQA